MTEIEQLHLEVGKVRYNKENKECKVVIYISSKFYTKLTDIDACAREMHLSKTIFGFDFYIIRGDRHPDFSVFPVATENK